MRRLLRSPVYTGMLANDGLLEAPHVHCQLGLLLWSPSCNRGSLSGVNGIYSRWRSTGLGARGLWPDNPSAVFVPLNRPHRPVLHQNSRTRPFRTVSREDSRADESTPAQRWKRAQHPEPGRSTDRYSTHSKVDPQRAVHRVCPSKSRA
jgi:hypothetical protein